MEGQDSFVLFRGRHDTVSSLVSFHHVLHRQHSSIASSCPARSSSVSCLSPGILYAVVASVCLSVGSQSLDFRVSSFIFRLQALTCASFLISCFRSTRFKLIKYTCSLLGCVTTSFSSTFAPLLLLTPSSVSSPSHSSSTYFRLSEYQASLFRQSFPWGTLASAGGQSCYWSRPPEQPLYQRTRAPAQCVHHGPR